MERTQGREYPAALAVASFYLITRYCLPFPDDPPAEVKARWSKIKGSIPAIPAKDIDGFVNAITKVPGKTR